MFSAVHHHAIPWHSILLWPRHKWRDDHYNCALTITPTKPPVAIWSVYCLKCWLIAALSMFTVVELNPALLTKWTPDLWKTSLWWAFSLLLFLQLLTSIQQTEASFPPLSPVPLRGQKKKNAWTECTWFISNVLYLHLWISNFSSLYHISM